MSKQNPKQFYPAPSDSSFERDLNYSSRGRGEYLGDSLPGYGDFEGIGSPDDNSQESDVQGEGYSKKGTWSSPGPKNIDSTKQPGPKDKPTNP